MWRHYVYLHRKASDGEVFYVGKGTLRKMKSVVYHRANEIKQRSKLWKRIKRKHGLIVEIHSSCRTHESAMTLESFLIKKYGRIDIGTGSLSNMTDGGDGSLGSIISDSTKEKLSKRFKGQKLNDNWKRNIGLANSGKSCYWYGRKGHLHIMSKKVVDMETGIVFGSIKLASEYLGISMTMLSDRLRGRLKNDSGMVYAEH